MKTRGIVLFSVAIGLLGSVPVVAVNQSTRDEENAAAEVRYYEPSSCSLRDSLNPSATSGQTTTGLSTLQADWVDKWHETAQALSIEFGIPWEAVMAQSIVESAAGTSYYATTRNNFFGLGAIDSNPDNAYSYETPEAGWRGYYEFIRNNSALYSAHGVFAEPTITNPYKYLEAIKAAGYATADNYVEIVSQYIERIEERSKVMSWRSSAELAKAYPDMLERAGANRGGAVKYSGTFLGDGCNCSGGANNSGYRWVDGFIVSNTATGYTRSNLIGTANESLVSSHGYGLSFEGSGSSGNADKITIRTVAPGNISNGTVSDALALYPNGDFPHFVVDIKNQRMFQFFSADRASAAMGDKNRESGIVIDVVGYVDESQKDSSWYLLDAQKFNSADWGYLAKLLRAVNERYRIDLTGEGDIWETLSLSYEGELVSKCASLEDIESNIGLNEARQIAKFYDGNSVKVQDYSLPLNTKNYDASFVAYFVQRFTTIGKVDRDWGYGRDTAFLLKQDYPELGAGVDPKPLAVFSITEGSTYCGSEKCGHTGIVVAIDNGSVTTIEASSSSSGAEVKTHPMGYFVNDLHPYQFVYLSDVINDSELNQGKLGK